MSRWINVEWVRNRINGTCSLKVISLDNLFHILTVAPSIDIVWCKECIWFDTDNTGEGYCTYVKGLADAKADDFCSYGERKGE